MLPDELIERIKSDLAEEFNVPIEEIIPKADVRQTLNLDSMRALQVIIIIKRHCGIVIMPRNIPHITTFQSLYDFIDKKMQQA